MNRVQVGTPLSKEVIKRYAEEETFLLTFFLNELKGSDSHLSYCVISDIESEVGVEIFSATEKIAEVHCAENRDGVLTGELQVHSMKNWEKAEILSVKEASIYVGT
ncbi:hypothetical protein ACJJIE_23080 [Microbulbifer sp. TRSA001]|uniref:hypothetical protein n=1 Tax=Microbulbifer sp. TRSA001 TaxID=3243381 RepID=UPI0040397BA3